jgi:hypothetical protein
MNPIHFCTQLSKKLGPNKVYSYVTAPLTPETIKCDRLVFCRIVVNLSGPHLNGCQRSDTKLITAVEDVIIGAFLGVACGAEESKARCKNVQTSTSASGGR